MDVSQRMLEVLPLLKRGVNNVRTPDLQPECEEEWNEGYAILKGLWYSTELNEQEAYFDHDRFRSDYEEMVRSHFPNCSVRCYWKSQEIEVLHK